VLLKVTLISVHVISCILFSEGRVNIFIAKVISAVLQCDRNLICPVSIGAPRMFLLGERTTPRLFI
jgi:hypothetical protein